MNDYIKIKNIDVKTRFSYDDDLLDLCLNKKKEPVLVG